MPAPDAPLQVAQLRCFTLSSRLKRPFVTARRRTEFVESIVAEVTLADGTLGQGSAAETVAVTGESASTMTRDVEGPLARALVGVTGTIVQLADAVGAALPGNFSAKAAVEVALHDAWARRLGRPLTECLGGQLTTFTHDMTVSLEDPDTMARHAAEAAASGYRILKIKLGADAELDRVRLRAVREAAPGATLRLDANQGWTPEEAVRLIDTLVADGLPIELIEQPVAKDDLEGLRRVTRASEVPIMADESLASVADAEHLAALRACDLFNIKLAKAGGIRAALGIADVARDAGIGCLIGSMMEPRISIAAAAHLAAAHPAITMIDLDAPEWFVEELPRGGYATLDGTLRLLGGPGLGVDLV